MHPDASTAMPNRYDILAAVAAPPSPEKPFLPFPATVIMLPVTYVAVEVHVLDGVLLMVVVGVKVTVCVNSATFVGVCVMDNVGEGEKTDEVDVLVSTDAGTTFVGDAVLVFFLQAQGHITNIKTKNKTQMLFFESTIAPLKIHLKSTYNNTLMYKYHSQVGSLSPLQIKPYSTFTN
jgi:hypothetical protein